MALGSTQPLTEVTTRNLPGGKGWPAYMADNLTAIYKLSRKCGSLNVTQPYAASTAYYRENTPPSYLSIYSSFICFMYTLYNFITYIYFNTFFEKLVTI
jgi:hypothetical protein